MQIPLQWGKLKFSVSIKVETRLTNLYGGLDCHIVELPRLPCRRSRVRWSFCDRYKQCDGVSKAKATIRRTIVKRLTPCVERRMGSRESKILCKLFAAQKSAKIDAWGMKGTWGELVFCTALLRNQGSSMSNSSAKRGGTYYKRSSACGSRPHIRVSLPTHIAVPTRKTISRCAQKTHLLFLLLVFNIVSFSLFCYKIQEILPNGFAASGGLLLHPVLLLLCLLP